MLNKFTSVQAFGPVVLARSRALRWLLDAKLTFFENPHAFLSVVALLIIISFFLLTVHTTTFCCWLAEILIVLLVYWLSLSPLYDTHTGPLKDKYRYWVGLTIL